MIDDPRVQSAVISDLLQEKPHQITLLDLMAKEAMGRMLAAAVRTGSRLYRKYPDPDDPDGDIDFDWIAQAAYCVAEAMLAERHERLSRKPGG